jgi:hypothetical protein
LCAAVEPARLHCAAIEPAAGAPLAEATPVHAPSAAAAVPSSALGASMGGLPDAKAKALSTRVAASGAAARVAAPWLPIRAPESASKE